MKIILADWDKYNLNHKSHNPHNRGPGLASILQRLNQAKNEPAVDVILVINNSSFHDEYNYLMEIHPFIETVLYKSDNAGYDFGAYNLGYQYLMKQQYNGHVAFLNSTVDIVSQNWLAAILDKFDLNTGLFGATYNGLAFQDTSAHQSGFHHEPFLHGYCLVSTMALLNKVCGHNLPGINATQKVDAIQLGEITISRLFLDHGYRIQALLHNFSYSKGEDWVWGKDHFRLETFINTRYKL